MHTLSAGRRAPRLATGAAAHIGLIIARTHTHTCAPTRKWRDRKCAGVHELRTCVPACAVAATAPPPTIARDVRPDVIDMSAAAEAAAALRARLLRDSRGGEGRMLDSQQIRK